MVREKLSPREPGSRGFGHTLGSSCDEQARAQGLRTFQTPLPLPPGPNTTPTLTFKASHLSQKHKAEAGRTHLWGIPRMTFSIPISLDLSMIVFRAGIMTSQRIYHFFFIHSFINGHLRCSGIFLNESQMIVGHYLVLLLSHFSRVRLHVTP